MDRPRDRERGGHQCYRCVLTFPFFLFISPGQKNKLSLFCAHGWSQSAPVSCFDWKAPAAPSNVVPFACAFSTPLCQPTFFDCFPTTTPPSHSENSFIYVVSVSLRKISNRRENNITRDKSSGRPQRTIQSQTRRPLRKNPQNLVCLSCVALVSA
jgi:hypothetical protein